METMSQVPNQFEEKDQFSDVALVVEGRKLYVSKTYLMIHSPVFARMFTGDFREKDLVDIELPGKKYDEVLQLLKQVYPGDSMDFINNETLAALLQLADEYDMQQVFYNCKEYMMKRINNWSESGSVFAFVPTDNILFYLGLVEQYKRLHPLRQILVAKASGISAHNMEKSKYFTSVPATATRDALLQRLKTKELQQVQPINRGFFAVPLEKK